MEPRDFSTFLPVSYFATPGHLLLGVKNGKIATTNLRLSMQHAARLIVTFKTLHQVLAAEKALRGTNPVVFKIRPTPTPPGLSTSICGMSIEILEVDQKEAILDFLKASAMTPSGIFEIT